MSFCPRTLLSKRRLLSTRRSFSIRLSSFSSDTNHNVNLTNNRRLYQRQLQLQQYDQQQRNMNSWQGHGTDLLGDSLDHNDGVPKIILKGHSETGFDINNMIKNMDRSDANLRQTGGIVHCAGSIIAFPCACFLWNVRRPEDLTAESLAPILLYRPELEYFFLGSIEPIPHELIKSIRNELRIDIPNLVIEPLSLSNAMGTFNVLNGEDRSVAVGLILPPEDEDDS
mmetsp:Transcript_53257/g.59526  ORF Transcript_53257/g.59526 Transcript_53257/m.59526 type:complete len:226 (+) Transcript_53257:43-720(+)